MADWSQLPPELLTLIAKRLETRFDVLRFRSVCSSWRSSFPPRVFPLPKYLPSKTKGRCDYSLSHITRHTFFLVRLPGSQNHQTAPGCWLVKIRDGTDRVRMRLLHPLSDSELKPLPVPINFPKVLDLTNCQVIELGHEFVGRYDVYIDHPLEPQAQDYREKVAITWSSTNSDDFMIVALFGFFVQYLAFLRPGEKEWTLSEIVHGAEDIISFNGKFYAIERGGRTIVVDQSLNASFLEHVGSPTSRKFLVQSCNNLLAVEMFFLRSSNSDSDFGNPVNCGSSGGDEEIGFRIFRMDEEEQRWDEMGSLGDQILILGMRQTISVSASEFSWGKGNLIFYSTDLCISPRNGQSQEMGMFVFDLEIGSASPLENCPSYCNLFWPPPEWVTSALQNVESKAYPLVVSPREVIRNSTSSATSAATDFDCEDPDSSSAISTREVGGKSPGRITSAGQETGSKRASPSSKFCFKFCCF
ncbi:F-box family protein [Theobroma cacao]|uniref:F-box family protein n=1 Tax=Theobroma cacao TaxID=3641 RepID=A0A061DXW4_THECC|nr:F-box family protein [Theobroma cacao]